MTTNESELYQFSEFVAGQLQLGSAITPEQCLQLWRDKHPNSPEYSENVKAIQQSINEMDSGRGSIDADDLHSRLRSRYSNSE